MPQVELFPGPSVNENVPPLPVPHIMPEHLVDIAGQLLWCGGWQVLFDYFSGLWLRSKDGCLGECFEGGHRMKYNLRVIY